jgi:hypothetical protein
MALEFEWSETVHGQSVLLAKKKHGKITIPELQEEMRRKGNFFGGWAIIVPVREESYIGWGDMDEPKGDVLELYQIGDDEQCPVCATIYQGIEWCPHCGERIREEKSK